MIMSKYLISEQSDLMSNKNCKLTDIILRRMPVVQKRSFVLSFLNSWKKRWENGKCKANKHAQQNDDDGDDDDDKFKHWIEHNKMVLKNSRLISSDGQRKYQHQVIRHQHHESQRVHIC